VTDASLSTCIVSICLTSHKDWFCTTSCHLKRRKWWSVLQGIYKKVKGKVVPVLNSLSTMPWRCMGK
jgi:hypothetical protein